MGFKDLWTLRNNFGTGHFVTFQKGHFRPFGLDTSGLQLWTLRDSTISGLDTLGLFRMATQGLFGLCDSYFGLFVTKRVLRNIFSCQNSSI